MAENARPLGILRGIVVPPRHSCFLKAANRRRGHNSCCRRRVVSVTAASGPGHLVRALPSARVPAARSRFRRTRRSSDRARRFAQEDDFFRRRRRHRRQAGQPHGEVGGGGRGRLRRRVPRHEGLVVPQEPPPLVRRQDRRDGQGSRQLRHQLVQPVFRSGGRQGRRVAHLVHPRVRGQVLLPHHRLLRVRLGRVLPLRRARNRRVLRGVHHPPGDRYVTARTSRASFFATCQTGAGGRRERSAWFSPFPENGARRRVRRRASVFSHFIFPDPT